MNRSVVFANLKYLATAYVQAGRFADAEQASREAYDLFGKELPADNGRLAGLHLPWGRALAGMGRWAEALPHVEAADRVLGKSPATPLQKINSETARTLLVSVRSKLPGTDSQVTISFTTLPPTSVSRNCRPWKR